MPKKRPARRNRTRELLQSQSVQTGRTIVDLLSQTLTNDEVARLVELKLVKSDGTTGAAAEEVQEIREIPESPQDTDSEVISDVGGSDADVEMIDKDLRERDAKHTLGRQQGPYYETGTAWETMPVTASYVKTAPVIKEQDGGVHRDDLHDDSLFAVRLDRTAIWLDKQRGARMRGTWNHNGERTCQSLAKLVRKLREFIYARIEPRKDAVLVANLLESTKVHPATMLGWYDYDRNKNNGHIVHFPIVIKAYFKCIENQLPGQCQLNTLVDHMKTYAELNSTKGATYNYEESRQTFESAVKYALPRYFYALHTNTR